MNELHSDLHSGASPEADETPLMEPTSRAELTRAAQDVASSVEQLYRVADSFVGRHAKDRPYAVLGAAAGIGFVLGGGLAWRLAGTLVNVAGRVAVTHALDTWLQANPTLRNPTNGL
jgi:hypothetical protein